jgi:hypothetical protein
MYQVYRAGGDRRLARHAAGQAVSALNAFTAKIGHPATRDAFLALDINREILASVRT